MSIVTNRRVLQRLELHPGGQTVHLGQSVPKILPRLPVDLMQLFTAGGAHIGEPLPIVGSPDIQRNGGEVLAVITKLVQRAQFGVVATSMARTTGNAHWMVQEPGNFERGTALEEVPLQKREWVSAVEMECRFSVLYTLDDIGRFGILAQSVECRGQDPRCLPLAAELDNRKNARYRVARRVPGSPFV